MNNKFNLNDIVRVIGYTTKYRIVGIELDTYNKPKKVWYKLYQIDTGHISATAENVLEKYSEEWTEAREWVIPTKNIL